MKLLPLCLLLLLQQSKTETKSIEWTQFRGPTRNAHAGDTGLLKEWPSSGPPLAWKATGIGIGFSSVCVSKGKVYTLGEDGGKANLLALNDADGKILWKLPIGGAVTDAQGGPGPRSTPATDGNVVVAVAPTGEIVCVQAATGRLLWQKHMERDFGASRPGFHFVESPLIDGPLVLMSPGGTVVALNKANGATVWKSKKLKGSTDYSSLSIAEMGKLKQYLVMTAASVAGLHAQSGAILWEGDFPGDRAVVPTPVFADGIVFVAAGYGVGAKGFRIALAGNQMRMQEAYAVKEFQIHHGGMLLVDGHVYGLADQGTARCVKLATGEVVWNERSVGKGAVIYADGHIIGRSEQGGVAMFEASPAGYKEKGRFTPPETNGGKCWAHPAVSGGKLYLREQGSLFVYDLRVKP
ncbi:MAG TPA: PQQ-binding-like beta-propeller repeat protein [Planctomycetota bacterium]